MKNLFYILPLFFILFSCDKIEEGDRSLDVDTIVAVRPALLEDFTGQNCTNCPDAARSAASIQRALGKNLVVVGIHAGGFSTKKYRTEAGIAYQKKFYENDGSGYPAGMIDRSMFEGKVVDINFSKWGTYTLERIQRTDLTLFDMSMICDYNAPDKSFIVKCTVKPLTDAPKVKLQLWITESHIIDYQRSKEEMVKEYEHNHVLRDAVNGIWGEKIEMQTGFDTNYTSNVYSLSDAKAKDWKPENMHVVGFIYAYDPENDEPGEVLHVVEIPMLNN